jgi:hypothetical protein
MTRVFVVVAAYMKKKIVYPGIKGKINYPKFWTIIETLVKLIMIA